MLQISLLIIPNLLIALLIGFIMGYIIGNISPNKTKFSDSKFNKIKNEAKPITILNIKENDIDNLKKIKGIDINLELKLNKLGIFKFNQISNWSEENCNWIEIFLNKPNLVKKYSWPKQAKLLAEGNETFYSQKIK